MIKFRNTLLSVILFMGLYTACSVQQSEEDKSPVDYVNPYIGNISHLLVPTYPTMYLPNSMLRVQPYRTDYTANRLDGLPVFLAGHRTHQAFSIHPLQGNIHAFGNSLSGSYIYDHEIIKPYFYSVYLDDIQTEVQFALSHQSAMYELEFREGDAPSLVVNTKDGEINVEGNTVSGYQYLNKTSTKVYIYLESEQFPFETGKYQIQTGSKNLIEGNNVFLTYGTDVKKVRIRYGISYIDTEQAKKNLYREIPGYDLQAVARKGKKYGMKH